MIDRTLLLKFVFFFESDKNFEASLILYALFRYLIDTYS